MPVRGKQDGKSVSTPAQTSGLDPNEKSPKGTSLLWKTARGMERVFSHEGLFWLGVFVFVVCFSGNFFFWFQILSRAGGLNRFLALLLAFIVSFGTTLFEVLPTVMFRNTRTILHQLFAMGAKPHQIPEMSEKVAAKSDDLLNHYTKSDREMRDFLSRMKWICVVFEGVVGFIFMGRVGAGLKALINLTLFFLSIFGCEWGASISAKASDWELPPAVKAQFQELINGMNQKLPLKKI